MSKPNFKSKAAIKEASLALLKDVSTVLLTVSKAGVWKRYTVPIIAPCFTWVSTHETAITTVIAMIAVFITLKGAKRN